MHTRGDTIARVKPWGTFLPVNISGDTLLNPGLKNKETMLTMEEVGACTPALMLLLHAFGYGIEEDFEGRYH